MMMEPSETPAAPLVEASEAAAVSDTQSPSPMDDSYSMDDHQEAKKSRGGKSKLFQCTGYGECRMVFTRSEHLARHMRKHTGEKPFKCVVPGCSRMFSRFDNMMQHTQTHNKSRAAPRRLKGSTGGGGGGKTKDKMGSSEQSLSDGDSYDQSGLPSPPPSRRGSEHHGKLVNKARMRRHRELQRKNYAEDDEEDELEYGDSDDQDQLHDDHSLDSDSDTSSSYHMLHHQHQDGGGHSIISQQRAMFAEMRRSSRDGYTLPPPVPQHYSSYGWPTSSSMSKTMINHHHDSIWPPPPPPPLPHSSIQAPIPLIPDTSSPSSSHHHHHHHHHIGYHRQHRLSASPMSSSSSTSTIDSSTHNNTSRRRPRATPKVQFHPYPYSGKKQHRRHSTTDDGRYVLQPSYPKEGAGDSDDDDDDDDDNDTRMILPRLATYLVAHPDEPPENYFLHHHQLDYGPTTRKNAGQEQQQQQQQPLMAQKRALTWPTLPGTEKAITRRLSVQDLCNPIECLDRSSSTTVSMVSNNNNKGDDDLDKTTTTADDDKTKAEWIENDMALTHTTAPVKQEEGIDLTLDEYEAIQGFGRFQKYDALK